MNLKVSIPKTPNLKFSPHPEPNRRLQLVEFDQSESTTCLDGFRNSGGVPRTDWLCVDKLRSLTFNRHSEKIHDLSRYLQANFKTVVGIVLHEILE